MGRGATEKNKFKKYIKTRSKELATYHAVRGRNNTVKGIAKR